MVRGGGERQKEGTSLLSWKKKGQRRGNLGHFLKNGGRGKKGADEGEAKENGRSDYD